MRVTLDRDLDALTERIIGAAFEVFNTLGQGFVEAVYKKALLCELRERGLDAEHEVPFQIGYKGSNVGTYFADIVVARRVIVELKVADALAQPHKRQVINCLPASGLPVGLLFNFGGSSLTFSRVLP
ncbi:GxxExxY protein [Azospirillum formosense]|uniref:GxxExxY protein n=1 Tax=Azospirillum formosense TaxID=861533 RepID=A0ABX2L0A2_9PROT|nr:GxxExxY protein [Azospirillum formosense]MBY3752005.1 GxxExxY protein [Azospirillum formosense]NUB21273.1 GxxExxY protein [Azospirillum formosense]